MSGTMRLVSGGLGLLCLGMAVHAFFFLPDAAPEYYAGWLLGATGNLNAARFGGE